MTVILTTTKNQNNNVNNNVTIIELGECEDELRQFYDLSKDVTIYMKKVEVIQEGMQIPKIEYSIYTKLPGENKLKRLNITACKTTKISISIPIEISKSENLDKLNTSSDYFNDVCYVASSDSGTDILLKDRKEEFIENNKTVCQDDLRFVRL